MSTLPDESGCIRLLTEAGCKRRVIVHCCTVCTVAEAIASGLNCDMDLVRAGALLHDIGRSVDHSIMHAVIGAGIAEDLGLPSEVIEIIRRHTGAGLDDEDVREFVLPSGDYIPRTLEQKIVAHADNMVSDNKLVPHTRSVEKLMSKGSDRGALRIQDLHSELSEICGYDLDRLVSELGMYPRMKGPLKEFEVD